MKMSPDQSRLVEKRAGDPPVVIHDYTYYRDLAADQTARGDYVDLETGRTARQVWRWIGWVMMVIVVGGVLTMMFAHLTNSYRIALVVVCGMLVYMLVAAKMVEGRFDRRDVD